MYQVLWVGAMMLQGLRDSDFIVMSGASVEPDSSSSSTAEEHDDSAMELINMELNAEVTYFIAEPKFIYSDDDEQDYEEAVDG